MIIGLSGLRDDGTAAGAGKDTVARFLVKNHAFEHMSFARPLKDFCKKVLGLSEEQVDGKLKETPDPTTGVVPRIGMQVIGDAVRACYEDGFVDCGIREAKARLSYYRSDGVVFSAGGVMWQIVRPGNGKLGAAAGHRSESSMRDWKFAKVLRNEDGSLEDLAKLVSRIIRGEQT